MTPQSRGKKTHRSAAGITLVELAVSTAVLALLLVLLLSMVNQTGSVWRQTRGKIEQFREAREGFESMTRRLSQATLNTYWDYVDAAGNTRTAANYLTFLPTAYRRQSELRFISGPGLAGSATSTPPRPTHSMFFQAPLGFTAPLNPTDTTYTQYEGLENLLNTWGYFIEFGDDASLKPSFVTAPNKNRFRLLELMQSSQAMGLYGLEVAAGGNPFYKGRDWFLNPINSTPLATRPVHVLAENVIALVLLPRLAAGEKNAKGVAYGPKDLAPNYLYDSTATNAIAALNPNHQLPPVVQVTMVAIDEASAQRLTPADNTDIQAALGPLFKNAANYEDDLKINPAAAADASLENLLVTRRINYRVFTTQIAIKGAKWSREQTN